MGLFSTDFEVVRSGFVPQPPDAVRARIEDFHAWTTWSPWEDVDPALQRTYSGPERGVGAAYAWKGNRKAGEGSMRVTAVSEDAVELDLVFLKPFPGENRLRFELAPEGDGTRVTWRMTGTSTGVGALFTKVMPVDKLVGPDFEKGLARMAATA